MFILELQAAPRGDATRRLPASRTPPGPHMLPLPAIRTSYAKACSEPIKAAARSSAYAASAEDLVRTMVLDSLDSDLVHNDSIRNGS